MSLETVLWVILFSVGLYALAIAYLIWRLYLFGKTVSNQIRISGLEELDDEH